MKRGIALVSVAVVAGLTIAAGTGSAATGPAPGTGVTGACNMLLAGGGMANAMTKDVRGNGNAGMFGAVAASGC